MNSSTPSSVGDIGNNKILALKLDMSKAYDQVEWNVLESMMRRLGFYKRWIMTYIFIVTYSCVLNGELVGFFCPSKGIHQMNPLSPFFVPSLY